MPADAQLLHWQPCEDLPIARRPCMSKLDRDFFVGTVLSCDPVSGPCCLQAACQQLPLSSMPVLGSKSAHCAEMKQQVAKLKPAGP